MPTRSHPLRDVIDAGRWDDEAPLGCLVVVVHAALLDAGFVPCGGRQASRRRLPEQVGTLASSLSLRYTIPELLRQRRSAAGVEAAVVRLCAHGYHVIFYGYLTGDGNRPSTHWACIDAPFVFPVLSGGLDATAHALANEALGVRLWKALAAGLSRGLFVDMCRKNSTLLPPRFMSLPADLQASILGRLAGEDLAKVECTCKDLRDLVAGRELWKAKFMAARWWFGFPSTSKLDTLSWKDMYVMKRQPWSSSWRLLLRCLQPAITDMGLGVGNHRGLRFIGDSEGWWDELYRRFDARVDVDRDRRWDPTKDLTERLLERGKVIPASGGWRRPVVTAARGEGRCGKGAVHAPSSRHRWMHR